MIKIYPSCIFTKCSKHTLIPKFLLILTSHIMLFFYFGLQFISFECIVSFYSLQPTHEFYPTTFQYNKSYLPSYSKSLFLILQAFLLCRDIRNHGSYNLTYYLLYLYVHMGAFPSCTTFLTSIYFII